jgi:hypothetical protein
MDDKDEIDSMHQMVALMDNIHRVLWQNPPPTLAQVKAVVGKMP